MTRTTLYILLDPIDLGDHVVGVFSEKGAAQAALDKLNDAWMMAAPRGLEAPLGLRIEELTLNKINCESWWWKQYNK